VDLVGCCSDVVPLDGRVLVVIGLVDFMPEGSANPRLDVSPGNQYDEEIGIGHPYRAIQLAAAFGDRVIVRIRNDDEQCPGVSCVSSSARLKLSGELMQDPANVSAVYFAARIDGDEAGWCCIEPRLLQIEADQLLLSVVLAQ